LLGSIPNQRHGYIILHIFSCKHGLKLNDLVIDGLYSFTNHLIGLGINHYFESQAANDSGRLFALSMSFLFAAVLAGFGYYARKGGDFVFILGAFLYLADGVILLGYREFFAFAFHIFAMYFIFKGLLASRRRYDPSVDATGA